MTSLVLAVTVVVVISAMCSLFEAVLYSIPVSHVEQLVADGRPAGKILRDLRENVDKPITAILSLNTISNTAGAAVAGALAAKALGDGALIYFSAAFTLVILLVSEVMPKTAGVVYAKPLSAIVARPLKALTWLFTPIVWLCGFATRLLSGGSSSQSVSEDELRVLAKLGHESGAIEESEKRLVDNALTLDRKVVRQIMTPSMVVFGLPETLSVGEVFLRPELTEHSRFPVFAEPDTQPVGIVYSRDVMTAAATDKKELKLSSLKRPLVYSTDDEPLDRTLSRFLKQEHHLMGVIGEFGAFRGVVTLEDVLEELLGEEIVDETDRVDDMQRLARKKREDLLSGE